MNWFSCPSPFLFNTTKHHAGAIREFMKNAKSEGASPEIVNRELLKVGNSMIDIYHGKLKQVTIIDEIKKHLKSMNCFDEESYCSYISSGRKDYRTVVLSDGSSWTLLRGRQEGNYIHIHPSRGSEYTIRARAIALKTAINLLIFHENEIDASLVELVNGVRQNYLGESPIKNEIYTRGIRRVLAIL